MDAETAAIPFLVVGYPVSVAVISRWVPVVRERRTTWLVAHHAAVMAIILGWSVRRPAAVPPNALWLVVSTLWYWAGGRRPGVSRRQRP